MNGNRYIMANPCKILRVMLIATVFLFGASSAQAVLIDFESFTAPTTILAGTDVQGLTFDQDISVSFGFSLFPSSTGNQGLAAGFGDFSGSFSQTVSSLSLAVGDAGGDVDSVILTGFNALDQIVDTDSFTAQVGQILSISGAGITRFEIVQSGGILFDNVTFEFESISVSAPGAVALFSLFLAGIGLTRNRARRI